MSQRSSSASVHSPTISFKNLGTSSPRTSLDQTSVAAPRSPGLRRSSLDSVRVHTSQEQTHHQDLARQIARLNTSVAAVKSLPTLTEASIERNDSTNSIKAEVRLSTIAKRHQPTSVYIRRSTEGHPSLPSVLPPVESQPSLVEDLANWMVPNSQIKRFSVAEKEVPSHSRSPTLSSPSNSIASCPPTTGGPSYEPYSLNSSSRLKSLSEPKPKIERHVRQKQGSVSSLKRGDELFFTFARTDSNSSQFVESPKSLHSMPTNQILQERAASIRSTASSITRKPLPATSAISVSSNTSLPISSSSDTSLDPSDIPLPAESSDENLDEATCSKEDPSVDSSPTTTISTDSQGSATNTPSSLTPLSDDAELSLLQQKMLHQNYVAIENEPVKSESKHEKMTDDKPISAGEEKGDHTVHTDKPLEPRELDKAESRKPLLQTEKQSQNTQGNNDNNNNNNSNDNDNNNNNSDSNNNNENNNNDNNNNDNTNKPHQHSPSTTSSPSRKSSIRGPTTPNPNLPPQTEPQPNISTTETLPPAPQPPPAKPKPMSAQAKRRAMHQRRMELAFGQT